MLEKWFNIWNCFLLKMKIVILFLEAVVECWSGSLSGGQHCAVWIGLTPRPESCADNWDSVTVMLMKGNYAWVFVLHVSCIYTRVWLSGCHRDCNILFHYYLELLPRLWQYMSHCKKRLALFIYLWINKFSLSICLLIILCV